jgi:hypothetical protein
VSIKSNHSLSDDGLFYQKKHGCEERVFDTNWGDKYRLEKVTGLPGTFQLPSKPGKVLRDGLPLVSIVVSESYGGKSRFLRWLTSQDNDDIGWKLLDASEIIRAFNEEPGSSIVFDRTRNEGSDCEIGIGGESIDKLVGLVEDETWKSSGNRLLVLARSVTKLQTDELYSNILARGHAYRLPHFMVDELVLWVEALLENQRVRQPGGSLKGELAKVAKDWTGGQPLLCHYFFRMVDDRFPPSHRWRVDIKDTFNDVGNFIKNHRPYFVHRWADALEELLQDPPTKRRLKAYAAGSTKLNDPAESDACDVNLFLSGWIGRTDKDTWEIASQCHKSWAVDVLRRRK